MADEMTETQETKKPTVRIPLPPQLKGEEERRKEDERRAATEQAAEAVAAARMEAAMRGDTRPMVPPTVRPSVASPSQPAQPAPMPVAPPAAPTTCPTCRKPITPDNARFSFCIHCGADLPKPTVSAPPPVVRPVAAPPPPIIASEPLPNGVRDPRMTMRKIAQVHGSGGQAQLQHPQTTVIAQVELDTRREINPTVNAICSFFLPGVGQLLNGQIGKGLLLIVGLFVAVSILGWQYFHLPILIGQTLAAIDAYRIGERRRNGEGVQDGEWDIA